MYGILLLILVCLYVGFMGLKIRRFSVENKLLAATTKPFSKSSPHATEHMLVLGDSTMYGAGIKNRNFTIGGLLAREYPHTTIETYASNGAKIRNVADQLQHATHTHYDLIIIGVGGNDVVRFTRYKHARAELEKLLEQATKRSSQVVLCHSVNVGNIGFFLFPFNYIYDYRSRRLSELYTNVAAAFPVVRYVNFYRRFKQDYYTPKTRKKFLAGDSFHPSEYANEYFFKLISKAL